MQLVLLLALGALYTGAFAANCTQRVISLNITSENVISNFPVNPTANDLIYYSQLSIALNGAMNISSKYITGRQNLTQQVDIWTQLCLPTTSNSTSGNSSSSSNSSSSTNSSSNTNSTTLQFLTHGIGFDASFWTGLNGNYTSYIDLADQRGQATFIYDRLGIGNSSKPNGVNNTQTSAEVAIAAALTQQLRSGNSSYGVQFNKIVHVGHSYGSIITNGLIANYPSLSDAAVLTGFSFNSTGMPAFTAGIQAAPANKVDTRRFGGFNDSTYLLFNSSVGNQLIFFFTPNFPPTLLDQVYAARQTVTVGELLTMSSALVPASNFKGPVYIVDGAEDQIFCAGQCYASLAQTGMTVPEMSKPMYPAASSFSTYITDGTGHAWPFQYSVNETSSAILNFTRSMGF